MIHTLASSNQSWISRMFFRTYPASEAAVLTDGLFMLIFWFGAFFFVVLMFLMFYWTVKYRRRPGQAPPNSPHHNTPLEILWTVVPSSALLVIFVLGFWGYMQKVVPPAGAIELTVSAWKWGWAITYPNGAQSPETQPLSEGEIGYPIFYVPENADVDLRMSSRDVIHAFWVPDFRTKFDVFPNRYTGFTFRTPALGAADVIIDRSGDQPVELPGRDMWIFCAEYCGEDHSRMAATLRIVPREIYERKMENWNADLPPVELGTRIHATRCATCHSVDGSPGTGPTWRNLFGHEVVFTDGGTAVRDENYIRESILIPNAHVVAGYAANMPSFQGQLDDRQIDGILAFMKSLSDRGGTPDAAEGTPDGDAAPGPSDTTDGGEQ